jgi:Protein of unknown function (DUF4232)
VAALAAASSYAVPATASAPRCTTYGLVIYLDVPVGNGYAGGNYYYIQFTNLSGHACTLRGYPGVSAVSLGGRQIGSPARWGSPSTTTVTLANGATAHANLQVGDPADFGSRCAIGLPARPGRPATFPTVAGFRVYPPDQTAATVIPYPFAACGHTGPVWMSAGAITPGGAPADGMNPPVRSAGGAQNGIFCRVGYLLANARRSSTARSCGAWSRPV